MSDWLTIWRENMPNKRLWRTAIGSMLLGSLLIVAFYVVFINDNTGPSFGEIISRIGLGMFLTTSLIYSVILVLAVIGWGWILGTFSGNWQWFQHGRIYCITAVTRKLPGALWYIVGRIVLYERLQVARSLTAFAGGVEFAAIILGGLLVAIVTWPIVLSDHTINPLWFLVGFLAGGLILNPVTLRTVLRRLNPHGQTSTIRYRSLVGWVLLYAGVWCGGGVILFGLATTIHPLPLTMVPMLIGIWATAGLVATLLSFVPLGLGSDLTIIALLGPHTSAAEALVIALLMRAILTLNEVLWVIVFGLLSLSGYMRRTSASPPALLTTPDHEPHSDG